MADDLLNPPKKDAAPVWFKKPGVEARVFPAHIARKLIADKNLGWEECEPEFVPKTKLRPTDDGKTHAAVKNANTEMTGRQIEEFVSQTVTELREYAQANSISLSGAKSKKEILEAIEKAGKLK
jgi:hypothetical protein